MSCSFLNDILLPFPLGREREAELALREEEDRSKRGVGID